MKDKGGQKILETVHYERFETVFTFLPISFTIMDEPSSSKRCHLTTGSTPHKPSEKRARPKENVNPRIRRPLSFSSENVPSAKQCLSSPRVKSHFSCYNLHEYYPCFIITCMKLYV